MTTLSAAVPVTTLPGEPVPYVIEAGSGRAHVLLGEVGRALAGAEETNGAMSVMALDGPKSERPIPLHYHDREFEFFYCLRGAVQLWADDESRVLQPGDFGYVPPGTLHAYQLRGPAGGRRRAPRPPPRRLRLRPAGDVARLPAARSLLALRRPGRARRLGPLLRPPRRAVRERRLPARPEGPAAVREVRPRRGR